MENSGVPINIGWLGSKAVCKKCGHDWTVRVKKKPTACPKCRNSYWDKDLRVKKQDQNNNQEVVTQDNTLTPLIVDDKIDNKNIEEGKRITSPESDW